MEYLSEHSLQKKFINPSQVQIESNLKLEHRRGESFSGLNVYFIIFCSRTDDLLSQHYERVMNRDQKNWDYSLRKLELN